MLAPSASRAAPATAAHPPALAAAGPAAGAPAAVGPGLDAGRAGRGLRGLAGQGLGLGPREPAGPGRSGRPGRADSDVTTQAAALRLRRGTQDASATDRPARDSALLLSRLTAASSELHGADK